MKIHTPIPSYAKSLLEASSYNKDEHHLIYSYFRMIDAQKYPYKNLREINFFNEGKVALAFSCMQESNLFSISEFQKIIDYYIYTIRNLDIEILELIEAEEVGFDDGDISMRMIHCLVYYFKFYVRNKKKPWSKRDVANEVFVENNLTAKEWNINETRNTGRY